MASCRECGRRKAVCPGGLCSPCHYDPAVRARHPLIRKTSGGKRHMGVGLRVGKGEAEPTDAAPGSEEKVRVMGQRAALGLPVFHPLDSKGDLK